MKPNLKLIGPIDTSLRLELNEEYLDFLKRKINVIYIAFGSVIYLQETEIKSMLVSLVRLLDGNVFDGVIWMLPASSQNDIPIEISIGDIVLTIQQLFDRKNIIISEWTNQIGILNHPNVKLFWSHGGLDSVFEALSSNTKLLITPFFGDQHRNARNAFELGVSTYFDKTNLVDVNKTIKAISDAVNNDCHNHLRVSAMQFRFAETRLQEAANIVEEFVLNAATCRYALGMDSKCEMKDYLSIDVDIINISFIVISIILALTISIFVFFTYKPNRI